MTCSVSSQSGAFSFSVVSACSSSSRIFFSFPPVLKILVVFPGICRSAIHGSDSLQMPWILERGRSHLRLACQTGEDADLPVCRASWTVCTGKGDDLQLFAMPGREIQTRVINQINIKLLVCKGCWKKKMKASDLISVVRVQCSAVTPRRKVGG